MIDVTARRIVEMSVEDVWKLNDQQWYRLSFDSGEPVKTTAQRIIFSRYIWRLHELYPKAHIHPNHFIGDAVLTPRTHIDLMEATLWSIKDEYEARGEFLDMELIRKTVYEIYSDIYNDKTAKLGNFIGSLCAFDVIDILFHPEVMKANYLLQSATLSDKSLITKAHDHIWNVIQNDPKISHLQLCKAARGKFVSKHSLLQCVSARGQVTDADSHFFPNPITDGFATGLTTLEALATESRSATKSVIYNQSHVAASEYMSRLMQLCIQVLPYVSQTDCGSTLGIKFFIDNSKDLENVAGKSYRLDNQWVTIHENDKHLIKKNIVIRSAYHCKDPSPRTICKYCIGETADSLSPHDNLGHFAATQLQSRITSLLLATKHLDSNFYTGERVISPEYRRFIMQHKDIDKIRLNPRINEGRYQIIIDKDQVSGVSDVLYTDDVDLLVPSSVSEVTEIRIREFDAKDDTKYMDTIIDTTFDNSPSYLTAAALKLFKKNGWSTDEFGNYVFELDGWNYKKAFLRIPLIQFSNVEYLAQIEKFVKSSGGKVTDDKFTNHVHDVPLAISKFYRLVSLKLSVNIAHLEVILMAMLAENPKQYNYSLPKDRTKSVPIRHEESMTKRSASMILAYQERRRIIYSISTFITNNREPHPFDYFILGD